MASTSIEKTVFSRPKALTEVPFSYCPGCTHGIVHRLVAECLDELGLTGKTIGVVPVGCSVTAYNFFNCDMAQAAHGRAPAVATGIKRARPDATVFSYQGDGDLAAIGTAETIHAAARGEQITVIFINNAIYGMTGGQMAPTSLPKQVTQTSPYGRDVASAGYPLRVVEMLATLDGVALAERVSVDTPRNIRAAKRSLRRAFEYQRDGLGYGIIEVLSTCPTNWGLAPVEALDWLRSELLPYYPLGVYRDVKAEGYADSAQAAQARRARLAAGDAASIGAIASAGGFATAATSSTTAPASPVPATTPTAGGGAQ
jgi:2-oxoglutarate ferredoxin oxidoreductase subunit beta